MLFFGDTNIELFCSVWRCLAEFQHKLDIVNIVPINVQFCFTEHSNYNSYTKTCSHFRQIVVNLIVVIYFIYLIIISYLFIVYHCVLPCIYLVNKVIHIPVRSTRIQGTFTTHLNSAPSPLPALPIHFCWFLALT